MNSPIWPMCRPCRARAAFTLAEALLAGALGLLCLELGMSCLLPTLRTQARALEGAERDRRMASAIEVLARDLSQTGVLGVSLATGDAELPLVLALDPIEDATADARLVWQPSLVVYGWSQRTGQLWRQRSHDLEQPASGPIRYAGQPLLALARGLLPQILCDRVSAFDVRLSGSLARVELSTRASNGNPARLARSAQLRVAP